MAGEIEQMAIAFGLAHADRMKARRIDLLIKKKVGEDTETDFAMIADWEAFKRDCFAAMGQMTFYERASITLLMKLVERTG